MAFNKVASTDLPWVVNLATLKDYLLGSSVKRQVGGTCEVFSQIILFYGRGKKRPPLLKESFPVIM